MNGHLPSTPHLERLFTEALEIVRAVLGKEWKVEMVDGNRLVLHPREADLSPVHLALTPWRGVGTRRHGPRLQILTKSTPELRAEFRDRGENFVDIDRRLVRIRAPGLYIEQRLPQASRPPRRATIARNAFSDRASCVTRTLLAQWGRSWVLAEVAQAAGVSTGLTSRVIRHLAEEGVITTTRQGRTLGIVLPSPWPLFLRWAASYRWTSNEQLAVVAPVGEAELAFGRIAGDLERKLAPTRWAFTGPVAASLLAPHATWENFHVYIDLPRNAKLVTIAERLGWSPSPEGRVILLRPKYRTSVWWKCEPTDGRPVVHPLQVMLDLWHYPVRGTEAATQIARTLGWPSQS